jgi:hypothetical protein
MRIFVLGTLISGLRRAETNGWLQNDSVVVESALVGLMTVPPAPPDVVMAPKAWRRPARPVRGVVGLAVGVFRPEAGVLRRKAERGRAVGVAIVFEVLERRIQRRMVIEHIVELVQHGGRRVSHAETELYV